MSSRVCILVAMTLPMACTSPPPTGNASGDESPAETTSQPLHNGTTPITTNENDLLISPVHPNSDCSGILLTNKWAVTARHCAVQDVVYDTPCATVGAACPARGGVCIQTNFGGFCGTHVLSLFDAPLPCTPSCKDVRVLRLQDSLHFTNDTKIYTIARSLYPDTEASLKGKNITIFGRGGIAPAFAYSKGAFTITDPTPIYSYLVSGLPPNNPDIVGGDSGGPGLFTNGSGFTFLTGITATPGSQHDIPEVYDFVVNTVYAAPGVVDFDARAYSQAFTSTGAFAFIRRSSSPQTVVFRSCANEPCDARGTWSTPLAVTTSATSDPAAVNDGGNPRVYVRRGGSDVWTTARINNAWQSWMSIGGSCASAPAAHARPSTSPPLIDITCLGTDGNIYTAFRQNGVQSGFGSLGAPPPGALTGSNVAVVSTDANTTFVIAVGADTAVWYRKGVVGSGWGAWTTINGGNVRWVAAASYGPNRLDVYAITQDGRLHVKVFDAGLWAPRFVFLDKGNWDASFAPFAAAFSGHLGRLNVGGIAGAAAHIQRYSDW
jgi:hypothetical protein